LILLLVHQVPAVLQRTECKINFLILPFPILKAKIAKDSDRPQPETKTKITAYLKPNCGWSKGVRAIFGKSQPALRRCDIINNPFNYTEILEKSGQSLSPCVEVNGHMLADVNGDEVEAYLLEAGVLHLTAAVADAPANWACDAHHHE
jgi:glutaredoxin